MLVSIDSSAASLHALEEVSALARSEQSQLVLLSVVPSYDGDLRLMGKKDVLVELKDSYIKALVNAENVAKAYNLNRKSVLQEGDPFSQILNLAENENVDLIVVDKKSSTFMDLVPVSAIDTKMISQSSADILVIPEDAPLNLDRILLAYDASEGAKVALKRSIDLSVTYGSELTIVTAFEVPLEGFNYEHNIWDKSYGDAMKLLDEAKKIAEEHGVRHIKTIKRHGKPSREICELARTIKAGLIILGFNHKNVIKKYLTENVMEQVIRNNSNPVWIAKSGR